MWYQEDQNRGKANWEHLNEDLHVLITVEDSENRARIKLQQAVDEVKKLLVPMVSATLLSDCQKIILIQFGYKLISLLHSVVWHVCSVQ